MIKRKDKKWTSVRSHRRKKNGSTQNKNGKNSLNHNRYPFASYIHTYDSDIFWLSTKKSIWEKRKETYFMRALKIVFGFSLCTQWDKLIIKSQTRAKLGNYWL